MKLEKYSIGQQIYVLIRGVSSNVEDTKNILLYKAEIEKKNEKNKMLVVKILQNIIHKSDVVGMTTWVGNSDVVKLSLKEVAETLTQEFDKKDLIRVVF